MNDQLNPKERELKELLENASFELDTNAIWDSIEDRIPHKENKNRFVIWCFGLGALLSVIAGLVFFFTSEKPFSKDNYSAEATKEINTEVIELPETLKQGIASTSNNQSEIAEPTASPELEPIKTINNKIANQEDLNPKPTKNNSLQINRKYINEGSVFSTINSINLVYNQGSENLKEYPISTFDSKQAKKINERLGLMSLGLISMIDQQLGFDREELLMSYKLAPISRIEPVNSESWVGFLSFGIGTNKNFSSNSVINSNGEFKSNLFDKESGQWGFGSELMYNLENRNGWSFGLGVSYDLNVSRYLDLGERINQTTSTGNTVIDIEADGTVNTLQGQLAKISVNNADVQWYRQHQNVDVQMRIAKNIWTVNRLSFDLEGGLLYNIYNRSSGYYFEDTANGLMKFNAGEENPYRKSQGFKAQVGLNIKYAFNNMDLGLRSYYRYNPNSILEKNHFYELKNSQLGFQISVAYRPNWE